MVDSSQENDTARKMPPAFNIKSATSKRNSEVDQKQLSEAKMRASFDAILKKNVKVPSSPAQKVLENPPPQSK